MKALLTIAAAAFALAASGAPEQAQNHVPAEFGGFGAISPKAATRNHLLVANVAGAIPEADWPICVNYAASRVPINIATNAVAAIPEKRVGGKAVVAVYIIDDESAEQFLAAPCAWSVVNIAWLKADGPESGVLRDRYAKAILKGVALACGAGATIEPRCSLHHGSRTLEGMDRTNITISPMAYFPMLETLRALGGDEAASPFAEEEAE